MPVAVCLLPGNNMDAGHVKFLLQLRIIIKISSAEFKQECIFQRSLTEHGGVIDIRPDANSSQRSAEA